MPYLFIFIAVLLIAVYLLTPIPKSGMNPTNLNDFQVPDNSSSKVVPMVYGTAYLKGNCIFYGNLNSIAMTKCA
jgi:hypothetical protein